jgi:phosphoenolpyruvate synthase/pyruvate phosphate dikinase
MRSSLLVDLAAREATDSAVVGAKAAALAQACRAGLPVLPGFVLPVAAARPAISVALAAAAAQDLAAARRAVLRLPVPAPLAGTLAAIVDQLGGRVIVRSSSPLESDHRWSGAFSSIAEVRAADAAVAVRSCWASAFAPDPLARAAAAGVPPHRLGLAVLLQPELTPTAGGTARVVGDEVRVSAVPGHPGALLAGRATGQTTVVTGGDPATPVAELARRVAGTLGYDHIEWATAGADVYLLQASRTGAPPAPRPAARFAGRRVPGTRSVAGDAVGRLRYVRPHEGLAPAGRPDILVCERPVPALAPLLFGASGLVSLAGPAECHLVEVARALGVPCLVDTPVSRLTGPPERINAGNWLAAIDGARDELVLLGDRDTPMRIWRDQ